MQNKRKSPRIFFEDTVRYETKSMSIATIAYDISPQAVFIKTLRPAPVETTLVMYIPNLDPANPDNKVRAIGKVKSIRNEDGLPRGMVVKFDYKRCSTIRKLVRRYITENRLYISGAGFLKKLYDISAFVNISGDNLTAPKH